LSGVAKTHEGCKLTKDSKGLVQFEVHIDVVVADGCQIVDEQIRSFSCFNNCLNEVLLEFQWLVLEPESCGLNSTFIIEDNIERVLFSTDAILLAALAVNFDLCEHLHLLVKRENLRKGCIAIFRPHSLPDEVFERSYP
jgi:hypothetical protein